MNLEEHVYNELLDMYKYTDKAKKIMTDLYMKAYHNGRHAERNRLIKDGFLIIDPNKVDELKRQSMNPCKACSKKANYLKIGCTVNSKECELKQKQLRAIEILTHFLKKQ